MQYAEEENQRYGWVMKKKVRWNSLHVKLQQRIPIILKEEIGIDESEIDVLICEPEQGPFLRGDVSNDVEERLTESLIHFVEITYQLMEEMNVRPNETKRSYHF